MLLVVGFALAFAGSARSATTINLGAAESFGALSFTAMTNADAAGPTVVSGDVGSPTSVGAGVTNPGFARYNGPADAAGMASAQAAVTAAYLAAEAQPTTGDVTGNLGGTKGPGVYDSSSAILINSALTLDGGGDPNAVFIFRAVSDLTVEVGGSVAYTNGAQPCNVFWKVDSAWLKNSGSTFVGTILALTQITLTDNITVQGRVLARNADVTFIHDTIVRPTCAAPVTTTAATTTTTAATTTTTTAATTTAATTTAATTTAATTTTPAATTTAAATTTPAGTTTPAATTTPAGTTTPARTATTATTTATAKAPKAAAAKPKPARGHARPPRHSFGLTG
jgi:type VI secretion system secreted protein VgrG